MRIDKADVARVTEKGGAWFLIIAPWRRTSNVFNPLLPSPNKYKDGEAPSRPHHVPKAARSGWVECTCIIDSAIILFLSLGRRMASSWSSL